MLEAKGGFMTIGAPPQEFVMVNVPVLGGSVTVTVPLTLYCCVACTQAVGLAVIPLKVQRMAQFVAPPPPVWVAIISVGTSEKFVIKNMYHCPTIAPVMSTYSVASVA